MRKTIIGAKKEAPRFTPPTFGRMVPLGGPSKVPGNRGIIAPKPVNLPSRKSESNTLDSTGSVWGTEEKPSLTSESEGAPSAAESWLVPPANSATYSEANGKATSSAATATTNSKSTTTVWATVPPPPTVPPQSRTFPSQRQSKAPNFGGRDFPALDESSEKEKHKEQKSRVSKGGDSGLGLMMRSAPRDFGNSKRDKDDWADDDDDLDFNQPLILSLAPVKEDTKIQSQPLLPPPPVDMDLEDEELSDDTEEVALAKAHRRDEKQIRREQEARIMRVKEEQELAELRARQQETERLRQLQAEKPKPLVNVWKKTDSVPMKPVNDQGQINGAPHRAEGEQRDGGSWRKEKSDAAEDQSAMMKRSVEEARERRLREEEERLRTAKENANRRLAELERKKEEALLAKEKEAETARQQAQSTTPSVSAWTRPTAGPEPSRPTSFGVNGAVENAGRPLWRDSSDPRNRIEGRRENSGEARFEPEVRNWRDRSESEQSHPVQQRGIWRQGLDPAPVDKWSENGQIHVLSRNQDARDRPTTAPGDLTRETQPPQRKLYDPRGPPSTGETAEARLLRARKQKEKEEEEQERIHEERVANKLLAQKERQDRLERQRLEFEREQQLERNRSQKKEEALERGRQQRLAQSSNSERDLSSDWRKSEVDETENTKRKKNGKNEQRIGEGPRIVKGVNTALTGRAQPQPHNQSAIQHVQAPPPPTPLWQSNQPRPLSLLQIQTEEQEASTNAALEAMVAQAEAELLDQERLSSLKKSNPKREKKPAKANAKFSKIIAPSSVAANEVADSRGLGFRPTEFAECSLDDQSSNDAAEIGSGIGSMQIWDGPYQPPALSSLGPYQPFGTFAPFVAGGSSFSGLYTWVGHNEQPAQFSDHLINDPPSEVGSAGYFSSSALAGDGPVRPFSQPTFGHRNIVAAPSGLDSPQTNTTALGRNNPRFSNRECVQGQSELTVEFDSSEAAKRTPKHNNFSKNKKIDQRRSGGMAVGDDDGIEGGVTTARFASSRVGVIGSESHDSNQQRKQTRGVYEAPGRKQIKEKDGVVDGREGDIPIQAKGGQAAKPHLAKRNHRSKVAHQRPDPPAE